MLSPLERIVGSDRHGLLHYQFVDPEVRNGTLRSLAESNTNSELVKAMRTEAEYFDSNRDRMRYPEFRAKHWFVGSGVIEAGCKTVIGSRLKQSGMFWSVRGANAIIALRCCCISGKFESYWEERAS